MLSNLRNKPHLVSKISSQPSSSSVTVWQRIEHELSQLCQTEPNIFESQIKCFCQELQRDITEHPEFEDHIIALQKICSDYLNLQRDEKKSSEKNISELVRKIQAYFNANPEARDGKSVGWYLWMIFSGVIAIGTAIGTSGASVAELFGQKMFGHEAATNFIEIMRAGTVGENILISTFMAGAIGGIMWLNISGFEGFRVEMAHWTGAPADIAKKIIRLSLLVISGTAMETLARKVGWPFMLGVSAPNLYWSLGTITWFGVGAGISGVLLQHLIKNAHHLLPISVYGEEDAMFAAIMDKFYDVVQLGLDGDNTKKFHCILMRALNLPADASMPQIKAQIKMTFSDTERAFEFLSRISEILSMPYPSLKAHIGTKSIAAVSSVCAALIGVLSLFSLVKQEEFPEVPWLSLISAIGMGMTNVWMWSKTLYDFIMNALNPRAYFGDTWRNSSRKDKTLRVFGSSLAVCFGSMMGLIPLIENKNDTVSEQVIIGLEFSFGVCINTLVGLLGLNAVWQFFMGWINPTNQDIAKADIDMMKQTFFSLSTEGKRSLLVGLKQYALNKFAPNHPLSDEESATSSEKQFLLREESVQEIRPATLGGESYRCLHSFGVFQGNGIAHWRNHIVDPSINDVSENWEGNGASRYDTPPDDPEEDNTVYDAMNSTGECLKLVRQDFSWR